ncbi:MAG: hypothetical protein ABI858_03390 [Pseudoxanthomonas sp.]
MRFPFASSSLVVLLSMLSSSPAFAVEHDIFGITLGAPLTLPLCELSLPTPQTSQPRSKGPGSRSFDKLMAPPAQKFPKAKLPGSGLCVAPGTTDLGVANGNFGPGEYGYLVFAESEWPAWVAPLGLSILAGAGDAFSLEGVGGLVLLRKGRVIALHFNTTGFEAQSRVMELLKHKFGSPGSEETKAWGNKWGGNRDSISAQWRKPDLFVDYSSVVKTEGLSGGMGSLNIGNDLGRQVLETTNQEAKF